MRQWDLEVDSTNSTMWLFPGCSIARTALFGTVGARSAHVVQLLRSKLTMWEVGMGKGGIVEEHSGLGLVHDIMVTVVSRQ